MSMAQKIHDKVRELYGFIEDKEDVLFVLYRGGGGSTQCICGKPLNVITSITTAMDGDERIAKIIETACDAYTAYKMDERLKNKEI